MGGQECAAVPHGWGAFSRAFIPPCNLEGGRQLSDQSPTDLLIADRNPSRLLQIVVPRSRRSGLFLHALVFASIVPVALSPSAMGFCMARRDLPFAIVASFWCAPGQMRRNKGRVQGALRPKAGLLGRFGYAAVLYFFEY